MKRLEKNAARDRGKKLFAQEFIPKKRRRRLDLKTLEGTARESALVYRDFVQGTITLEMAEVRRRLLGTHKEIVSEFERQRQMAELIAEVKELRQGSQAGTSDPEI
jgi:hypothetical protein